MTIQLFVINQDAQVSKREGPNFRIENRADTSNDPLVEPNRGKQSQIWSHWQFEKLTNHK